jgi:PAS domain S-box-containing protein
MSSVFQSVDSASSAAPTVSSQAEGQPIIASTINTANAADKEAPKQVIPDTSHARLRDRRFFSFAVAGVLASVTLTFIGAYLLYGLGDGLGTVLGGTAKTLANNSGSKAFLSSFEWAASAVLISLLIGLSWLLSRFTALRHVTHVLETQQASLAAQHQTLIEAQKIAKCGSWSVDLQGNIISVSDEYLAIFNLTAKTRPKTAIEWIERFIVPDEHDSVRQNWISIKEDIPLDVTRHVRLDDGTRKWVQTITFPVLNGANHGERYRGIVRDVTVEKNAELLLADRTLQLENAKRIARLGSWYWDKASDSLRVCERVCEIYEVSPENCPATLFEWMRRFERPDIVWDDRKSQRGDSPQMVSEGSIEGIRHIVTSNGKSKWVQWIGSPSVNKEGKLIGYHGITRDVTTETQAERRLAQSETRYRLISERMHDVVTLHALNSAIIYVSPSVQRTLGYFPEKSIGQIAINFVHADDVERVREQISLVCNNARETVVLECRYKHLEGHYCWVETVITPVLGTDGLTMQYQSTTRDIDRRKAAEDALKTSEQRFRSLTELSSDWYWEMDEAFRFSFVSHDASHPSGALREFLIGKTPWEAFPSALTPVQWEAHLGDLNARRPFHNLVTTARNPATGEIKAYFSMNAEPIFSATGAFKGYWGTGNDITERKRAEEALRMSELRFRSLTELSSDWYWETDAEYRFTFVSSLSIAVSNLPQNGVLGKTRWELFPNAFTETEWAAHRADLVARRPFRDVIARTVDPITGEVLGYSSLSGEPIFNEFGDFHGYWGTGNDITDRKRAEEALANRTRELAMINACLEDEVQRRQLLERNFLMSIERELAQVGLELHDDLGQDLTGIALLTKTLERKLREHGMTETADAARISELVNRTIKHTRLISHGLSPYMWGPDGLVSALGQLASDIESLGVVRCVAELDEVEIDDEIVARNLYRIAQEAANNALKHGGATKIRISLKQSKAGVHLTITDNGMIKKGHNATELAPSLPDNADTKFYSIRHRASAIDAALTVNAIRNKGFEVSLWWIPPLIPPQAINPTQSQMFNLTQPQGPTFEALPTKETV